MRLLRKLTKKEWKEISEKYKDGGVHMYRGKKTLFYKGENLWDTENVGYPIHIWEERKSWQVIIVLPGVEIIPRGTFWSCENVETVIMANSVQRIEKQAFRGCSSLVFVKHSRNLECIGWRAFYLCESLTSMFIPPSCREIGKEAFLSCKKLLFVGMSQNVQLGRSVFECTRLIKRSPFETDGDGKYDHDEEEEVVQWIRSIHSEDAYSLHRACSSYNPLPEIIHDLVKRQGIEAMRMKNTIRITPSQYLEANTLATISEKEIVNKYILDMMGEII